MQLFPLSTLLMFEMHTVLYCCPSAILSPISYSPPFVPLPYPHRPRFFSEQLSSVIHWICNGAFCFSPPPWPWERLYASPPPSAVSLMPADNAQRQPYTLFILRPPPRKIRKYWTFSNIFLPKCCYYTEELRCTWTQQPLRCTFLSLDSIFLSSG